jgi:hypothetical protein
MSIQRTAWHPPFTGLLQTFGPRWTVVSGEMQLTIEPLRADDVITLRADTPRDLNDLGTVLCGMWIYVIVVALLEFKSISRPFRRGDLSRLIAYGHIWYFTHQEHNALTLPDKTCRRATPGDLTLILVVPTITPTLEEEVALLGYTMNVSPDGYTLVTGASFRLLVVDLSVAASAEQNDLMAWFAGRQKLLSVESKRWIWQHSNRGTDLNQATPDLEGFDEWLAHYVASTPMKQLLPFLPVEELLQSVPANQRLKGISVEERLLSLPDDMLRGFSTEYLATLPAHVRDAIYARIGR